MRRMHCARLDMDLTQVRWRLRTLALLLSCSVLLLAGGSAGQQQQGEAEAAQPDNQLRYVTNEESRASVFVGNIAEDADVRSQVPPEAQNLLTYSILSSSSPYARHFSLGPRDGILRIASPIDRDNATFCYQKVTCEIKLDIAVQPREYFRIIKVTVVVDDINDNAPEFLESHFQRSIAENTSPGSSFTIPISDDPDSPKFGVKRYELVTGSEKFNLKVTNSSDGSLDLHLVLRGRVDREEKEIYRVVVAAYDGGVPPNMGTLTADVIIQDVNDNSPVFDNETYNVVVSESIAVNQVVVRVHAKDPDMGPNGQIVYSFSTKTQQRFGHLFAIHNASGEITLKQALRYQDGSSYILSVTARDRNPDSLTTLAKVIIQVLDVNDNPPRITVNSLTPSGSVEIPEGEEPGSLVAHISVEDQDSGSGGEFTCGIDNPKFTTQQLYGGIEYKVVTVDQLDREEQDSYELTFTCSDLGDPPLTSSVLISVAVLDENDHSPVFSRDTYTAIMKENNAIGEYITTVTATDVDLNQNGEVEYKALGDANNLIAVHPHSGEITTKVSFDYENNQRLEIPVVAVDHGSPALTATTTLVLSFTDEDDSKPEFTQPEFTFNISENQPMGTLVGQVTAIDADSVPFNDFTYFLSPSEEAHDSFFLDGQNGKIFTKKSLDRETQSQYTFEVKAVSTSPPVSSSTTMVSVVVTDQNDHFPRCSFPTIKNNTAYIIRTMTVGERITRLNCSDDDVSGPNASLKYTFVTNNQNHLFGIQEATGEVFAKSEFKGIQEESFSVTVKISDSGDPPKDIDVTLNLVVNKSMSEPPIVNKGNLTIVISVVVCSAFLVLVLIVAIILVIRRKDRRRKYVDKKVLVAADVNKSNIPVRVPLQEQPTKDGPDSGKPQTHTKLNNASFALNDEQKASQKTMAPEYPRDQAYSVSNHSKQAPTSYSAYAGSPAGGGQQYGRPPAQDPASWGSSPAAAYTGAAGSPYHEKRRLDSVVSVEDGVWPRANSSHSTIKESDNDSVRSAPASNSDSGRGSNEDADSGPLHHPQIHNSRDGVMLHPQPHWSRGRDSAPPPPGRVASPPPAVPSRRPPTRHASYKDTLQLHGRVAPFPSEHHQRYGASFRETPSHRDRETLNLRDSPSLRDTQSYRNTPVQGLRETPTYRDYSPYGHLPGHQPHHQQRQDHNHSDQNHNQPRVYLEDSYGYGSNSKNRPQNARDRPVHYITASQV